MILDPGLPVTNPGKPAQPSAVDTILSLPGVLLATSLIPVPADPRAQILEVVNARNTR